jgi:rod shape-determining protein MreD
MLHRFLIAAALVAAQLLLFNNLQLRGLLDAFVAPCVYILYLVVLPVGVSRVGLLLVSFALGVTVDFFSGTLGVNTAACVLLGFVRPKVITLLVGQENVDKAMRPTIYTLGYTRWLGYAAVLTFVFHLALFLIEVFSLYELHLTLLRAALSTVAAVALMVMLEIVFENKDKRY